MGFSLDGVMVWVEDGWPEVKVDGCCMGREGGTEVDVGGESRAGHPGVGFWGGNWGGEVARTGDIFGREGRRWITWPFGRWGIPLEVGR